MANTSYENLNNRHKERFNGADNENEIHVERNQ